MKSISRRGFLGTVIGGVVAGAAVRTWPFRVFSFPSVPSIPFRLQFPNGRIDYIDMSKWGLLGQGTGTTYDVIVKDGVRIPIITSQGKLSQFKF
jgi:hypothetical protein